MLTDRNGVGHGRDSRARTGRRAVLLGAAGLLIALLVYGVGWVAARERLLASLERQPSTLPGLSVAVDAPAVEGFPLRFELAAESVTARLADGARGRAEPVRAVWRPWRPLSLSAAATDAVSYVRPLSPGRFGLAAEAGAGVARWRLSGDLAAASVTLEALRLALPGWRLEGERARFELAAEGGGADAPWRAALDASRLLPIPGAAPVAGLPEGPIDRLRATVVARPSPALPITRSGLAAWRDGGGALDVEAARLDWGALSVAVDGHLGLDAALRPTGRLEARVAGGRTLIEALSRAGMIRPGDAGLILGVLGGLEDEDGRTTVPLRLGDGWLAVGPFPIVRLAPVM